MAEQDPQPWRWRGGLADAAALLLVIGLGVKAVAAGGGLREIDFADECGSMRAAQALPEHGPPSVEYSPLYTCWYALLLQGGRSPFEAFSLNWALLAVALPTSAYLLARGLGATRLAALTAAGALPATTIIDIWPFPMYFATVVLALGGAIAAATVRRGYVAAGTAALGLTFLTATYSRPEFLYSLYLFLPPAAIGAAWMLVCRPESRRGVLMAVAGFAAGAALLAWAFGSPKGDGGRPIIAFGEHYTWNRFSAAGRTDYQTHHWPATLRADFGDAASLGELWRNNRSAFLWHVNTNARNLPASLLATAEPRVDPTTIRLYHCYPVDPVRRPSHHPNTSALVRAALLALLAVGLFGALAGLRSRDTRPGLIVAFVLLALVAAPAIAASLIIFPRYHYLTPTVVFSVALAAAGARHFPAPARWRELAANSTSRIVVGLLLAVGLAAVVPNRTNGWCLQTLWWKERDHPMLRPPTPLREATTTLRSFKLPASTVVATDLYGVPFYAGLDVTVPTLHLASPREGFQEFVARRNVGVVILDPHIAEFPAWRADPDFRQLVEGRENATFRVFPVAGYSFVRIAVRRDLLSPEVEPVRPEGATVAR